MTRSRSSASMRKLRQSSWPGVAAWRFRLRSDSLSPALEGHLAKYRKLVPALALIDHLAEGGNGGVGKEALLRALAMAEYLETHARRIYGATRRSDSGPHP